MATNARLNGFSQVGMARTDDELQRKLSRTKLPVPFVSQYIATVDRPEVVLSRLKEIFSDRRISGNPSLFYIAPSRMIAAVSLAAKNEGTTLQPTAGSAKLKKTRGPNWNFDSLDIPEGAVLEFNGNPDITCTVAQLRPPMVSFGGETMPPSTAASRARGTKQRLGWTSFWVYEGETIRSRQNRFRRS